MSDGGGEYKSKAFDEVLKNRGIKILQSIPHTLQKNSQAEHLMYTLSDKAESMCLDACLPDSWWNFAFQHACYLYNQTPQTRLNWHTPHEMLEGEKPIV